MSTENLAFASVTELVAGLESRTITSRQIVQTCLDRIDRFDDRLHSFVTVYAEDAIREADEADAAWRSGSPKSALHGIPLALKDIIDIEGRVTTGGSKAWEKRISPVTATLATRARDAGMIIIGKTHTVEFAMGSFGTNQHMGSPRNPWDDESHRATGGSSSGSGASVAAGLVPWAIGTDTGGSVRIPSSWCGLTGLKTTIGRISVHGVLPLAHSLDTPGPMCRTVDDAALLFCALSGYDPLDRLTARVPADPDPWPTLNRGIQGLAMAKLPERELDGVADDVRQAYDESLRQLGALGAEIVEFRPPWDFQDMGNLVGEIIGTEGYRHVGHLTDDADSPVDEDVRPRIGIGRDATAAHYFKLMEKRESVRQAWESAMAGVDALITPSTHTSAPVAAEIDQTGSAAGFTRAINLVDQCALSLPNGFAANGMPTGLQIACRGYDEAMALRIGKCLQAHTDFHTRHPAALV